MKQAELKPCLFCKKGVMHDNAIACVHVKAVRMMANVRAIERQHGLEMMLGSPGLANVMGTNEDLLIPIDEGVDVLICDDCAIKNRIFSLLESRDEEQGETG